MDKELMIAIIVIACTIGWLVNNWIRARHGYPLEDEWGGKSERIDSGETKQLRAENQELRTLLTKVDRRMQVLERIVTDKGYTVAEEIEALRRNDDRDTDSSVQIDANQRENV